MYGETRQTLRLGFQPTNQCNLACSYCYQTNKGYEFLPVESGKFLIDKLFEGDETYFKGFLHKDYLNVILDFIGGEVTLYMDFVEEITEYFIEKCLEYGKGHWLINFEVWLETNGTTYFEPQVQAYIKKHNERLALPITLDGAKVCHDACRKYHDGSGSYDDVVDAMTHYINTYGKYPNTKITISPDNVSYLHEGLKKFVEMGFDVVRISCVAEDVWEPRHDKIWEEQLRLFYEYLFETKSNFWLYPYMKEKLFSKNLRTGNCGTAGNMLFLNYKGDLFLCHRFSEISDLKGKEPLSIGNIQEGITEAGLQRIEGIKKSLEGVLQTKGCKDCNIGQICESCPAHSYENGTAHQIIKTNCKKMRIAHELLSEYQKKKEKLPSLRINAENNLVRQSTR
jgi:uncharacterized protein